MRFSSSLKLNHIFRKLYHTDGKANGFLVFYAKANHTERNRVGITVSKKLGMQDLKVAYDGTVRSTGGKIIQFKYGEDGTDPAKSASGLPVDVKGIAESVLKEAV